ncbi:hypothetical protein ACFP56_12710 [Paenibacillus septentrionalis]|uniref:Uncharacterized protein n=1 Tax=Paenibacillus septentrionalis TaxID=429342 RepID=A0ABW1V696_9BACL
MANARCKERLVQYELIVYQMAMLLHQRDSIAIEITKQVLCELWREEEFFDLEASKQRSRLIWLVSQASARKA